MRLCDFSIGLRVLLKTPAYTSVAIIGLSLGVTVFFFLSLITLYAFNFNSHIPDRANVFAVKYLNYQYGPFARWRTFSPLVIREVLKGSGIPVEVTGTFTKDVTIRIRTEEFEERVLLVDTNFSNIFNIRPQIGDLKLTLADPNSVALTASTAKRVFGNLDPLWQKIEINGQTFRVTAILPDVPSNSTERYQILAGFDSSMWSSSEKAEVLKQWSSAVGTNYIKIPVGTNIENVRIFLQARADASPEAELSPEEQIQYGANHAVQLALVNLEEIYFDKDLPKESNLARREIVIGLFSIALLILFLASSNYVTLAGVRTLERQKEIAIKKVLGLKIRDIVSQFFIESTVVSLSAGILGVGLVYLFLPVFSLLIGLELNDHFTVSNIVKAMLFSVFLGLITALYPSYLAIRVPPKSALVVANDSESSSGLMFRKLLTIIQFSFALGLSCVCALIGYQTFYATTVNPGYDIDDLFVLDLKSKISDESMRSLEDRLKNTEGIIGVSSAIDSETRPLRSTGAFQAAGRPAVNIEYSIVTPNFFQVHGISAKYGRLFDAKIDQINGLPVLVINEAAAQALGFESADKVPNQFVEFGDKSRQILGVVPNILHSTLKTQPVPLAYLVGKPKMGLAVRVGANHLLGRQSIEKVWNDVFPNKPIILNSARSIFQNKYKSDIKLVEIFACSGVAALLLSIFGIYVLSAANVQRRAKEIVIRKLFGADKRSILKLLLRDFVAFVFVCALLSMPLAWVFAMGYLADYIHFAPLLNLVMPCVLIIISAIALVAIFVNIIKAMNMMPSEILKR